MDIITVSGLVGTAGTLIAIFIPENWRSKRMFFISAVTVSAVLAGIVVDRNSKLTRIKKISRSANELLKIAPPYGITYEGFVQAGLSFLEENKDIYPDSYDRAKDIAVSSETGHEIVAAAEMEGIIHGIAILNTD